MKRMRAVIMAGGKSERMRATAGPTHKALAYVRGLRLLEWNLRTALFYGFRDIIVATSTHEPEIDTFLEGAASIVADSGATLATYVEKSPLGNIGAARETIGPADSLLMLYVDNLAAIDLRALAQSHERRDDAMTIATHVETFTMPFGELTVSNGDVTRYTEKPEYRIRVSSGTCMLSRRACDAIREGESIGASQLFARLFAAGERVGAFEHDAPWIDINDAAALARADRVVDEHWPAFKELRGA